MGFSQGHTASTKQITILNRFKADESKILISKITLPIQINGKVRAKVEIDAGMTEEEVVAFAR